MRAILLAVLAFGLTGCDKAQEAATEVSDQAGSVASDRLAKMGDRAASYVDEQLAGLLSGAEEGSVERRVLGEKSSVVEVATVAKALADAYDSDTRILPVYRKVGDDQADVDAAIGEMPRTEVIDGVTVGFKQLRAISTDEKVDEDAYLVLWRRGDRLIGFVYRKKSRIDIDALVRETPKVMELIRSALAS